MKEDLHLLITATRASLRHIAHLLLGELSLWFRPFPASEVPGEGYPRN